MLRIDELEELVGMDISHHKGATYEHGDATVNHTEAVELLNVSCSGRKVTMEQPEYVVEQLEKDDENNKEITA